LKIYVSGAFDHREELSGLAGGLIARGHEVTSNWLDEPPLVFNDTEYQTWERRARANEDMEDVRRADAIVFVTLWPSTTGGRHWEAGAAYAWGKTMYRIGPIDNCFGHLSCITGFDSVNEFLQYLDGV
jgi:hypothetical protein